jgi:hypothetical protein
LQPSQLKLCHAAAAAAAAGAGMVPLALVGRWGTLAPINSPMTVVFGKPIDLPHKEHPTDAEVSPGAAAAVAAALASPL